MANPVSPVMGSGLILLCALSVGGAPGVVLAQSTDSLPFPSDGAYLRPADTSTSGYDTVDAERLKRLVVEQTAIARRYRDAGNQYWGRIIGTRADHETASWMADRLRQAGAEVRVETLDLAPQWVPRSWALSVHGSAGEFRLASASPTYASVGPGRAGIDVEVIDVGLGMDTDFSGRVGRGKAVGIHAIPRPGIISLTRSTTLRGAIAQADERGAAAILIVIELPGNLQTLLYLSLIHI